MRNSTSNDKKAVVVMGQGDKSWSYGEGGGRSMRGDETVTAGASRSWVVVVVPTPTRWTYGPT